MIRRLKNALREWIEPKVEPSPDPVALEDFPLNVALAPVVQSDAEPAAPEPAVELPDPDPEIEWEESRPAPLATPAPSLVVAPLPRAPAVPDTPEAIAAWAERKTTGDIPSKRPQGRAGHLSEPEKHAIRLAYLESAGTVTYKALGVRFGVNRETAAACCKGPEFKALQKQVEGEMRAQAVQKLKALTMPAVDAWGEAIPIAALKGDHRPARELLQHVGIVEDKKDAGSGLLVLTSINIHGVPALKGSDGNIYTPDPENPGEYFGDAPKADVVVQIGGLDTVQIGGGALSPELSPPGTKST